MFAKCVVLALAVPVLLSLCSAAHAQTTGGQWLIEEAQGQWEVRERTRKVHPIAKFEILTTTNQIRCLSKPCALFYATDKGETKPFRLPSPVQIGGWIQVPAPSGSPAGPRAAGLQELIAKVGVRGGRRKDSPVCSGELPLMAPMCGELIDPVDFVLQWTARPSEAGKSFTVLVGGADSSERKRWNAVRTESGEFRAKTLDDYLASLQLPDRPTDVTIRVMRTESLDAIRLVHLQSRADDAEYRKRLQTAALLPGLSRNLALLEQFLTMGMWSRAAQVSQQLLRDAPNSLEIQKYALIGFCRSDFSNETAALRASLKDAGVTAFCDPEGTQ